MQFGFMPGKGTTDAIFIMRQVQEKHQAKKKLYYAFVVRWALRKLGVDKWHSYGILYMGLHCS